MERTTTTAQAGAIPAAAAPGSRGKHPPEMRPGMMTDSEINAELKTATGERLAALQAEREERKAYRASMRLSAAADEAGSSRIR